MQIANIVRLATSALVAALIAQFCAHASAALITGSEPVHVNRDSVPYDNNGVPIGSFHWEWDYNQVFDGFKVTREIRAQLIYENGFDPFNQEFFSIFLEACIEDQWNDRFALQDNATKLIYPIEVDFIPVVSSPQQVSVRQGIPDNPNTPEYDGDAAAMTIWYDDDEPGVFAHEVGHMLGLFDEYMGGALTEDQFGQLILSNTGLMGAGARAQRPRMFARYFPGVESFVESLNPDVDFLLVQVSEPASGALFCLGIAALAYARHRRKRT